MKKTTTTFVFLFVAFSWLAAQGNVTFNLDATGGGFAAADRVFISGAPWGWPMPGDNLDLELLDGDADGIFSVTLPICARFWEFKFFKNTGWDNGEPIASDRVHVFTGADETIDCVWGDRPESVTVNNPLPVNFEQGVNDMSWATFSLGPDPLNCSDFSIVANPDVSGINKSANAIQFVVHDNADQWAGAWTEAYDTIKFTEDNHILSMMVYRSDIGRSALKVESSSNGGPVIELFATNTKTDEWELLTFDFTAGIGYEYPRFVFFPDFPEAARTDGATVLVDNIAAAVKSGATFNLDTTGGGFAADDRVFISGSPWGWPMPGDNLDLELLDGDADGIFSVTLPICARFWEFKFFKNTSWDNGEPIASDRVHVFTGADETIDCVWGDRPESVTVNNPLPVNFEQGVNDMSWATFSLGPDPLNCSDFSIVANPDASGINTSANAIQFVVHDNADQWAGAWTEAYETITFTEEYHTLTMMVYRSDIGRSALKVESSSNGGPVIELFATNTKTDEWELLTYDFSAGIGYDYPRFVFFPDFPEAARTDGATVLVDNIAESVHTPVNGIPSEKANGIKVYPNPATDLLNVTFPTENAKVVIYNSIGRKIEEVFVEGRMITFDVSDYVNGLYFVKVNDNAIVKFVK
ncbi:MAG: T9SS type A sorting domain-containing protein [Bacteroidales bacterium]|nr:T9SS type A sorting domain-containing protein [Bacteroidales bacterium]